MVVLTEVCATNNKVISTLWVILFFIAPFDPIEDKETNGHEYTKKEDRPVICNRKLVK